MQLLLFNDRPARYSGLETYHWDYNCSQFPKKIRIHQGKALLRVFLVEQNGRIWITWVEEMLSAQLGDVPVIRIDHENRHLKVNSKANHGQYPSTEPSDRGLPYALADELGHESFRPSARHNYYMHEKTANSASHERGLSSSPSLDEKTQYKTYSWRRKGPHPSSIYFRKD